MKISFNTEKQPESRRNLYQKYFLKSTILFALTLMIISSPVMAGDYGKIIYPGETVFIGESGLDVSNAIGAASGTISYYGFTGTPGVSTPIDVVVISDSSNYYISSDVFTGKTGAWYVGNTADVAFYVQKSSLSVSLFNNNTGQEITDKKAITDEQVAIRLNSNLDALFARNASGGTSGVNILIETPDGATLAASFDGRDTNILTGIKPTNTLFWLPSGIREAVWALDIDKYETGTYKIYAKVNINGMKDNLGTITGVTKSEIVTLLVDTDTIAITADKETIIRNNDFTVTLDGSPKTNYVVWLSGTNSYSAYWDYPPKFIQNQDDVTFLNQEELNSMVYKTGTTVASDVPYISYNYYEDPPVNEWAVKAMTGSDGRITIGLTTDGLTKDAVYTVRAERYLSPTILDSQMYDTVKVKVEKGEVTIATSGDGSYYPGEEITLSGTNTDTNDIYLFITGPDIPSEGGILQSPYTPVNTSYLSSNNTHVEVKTDDTWEYKWNTSLISDKTAAYTIYAASFNVNNCWVYNSIFDTANIVIKSPFIADNKWITIDPVDDLYAGDKFTVSGETNLTVGDNILVDIGLTSQTNEINQLSGVSGIAPVTRGTINNTWSLDVDTSGFTPGSYTIKAEAASAEADATAEFSLSDGKYHAGIILKNGWNFVSTPKRLESTNGADEAGKIFEDVDSGGHSALMYNASSGNWDTVKADTVIKPLEAVWIYSNEASDKLIDLTLDSNPLQSPPSKELKSGWNTIGFSSDKPACAKDTLVDVSGKWTKTIGWNAASQMYDATIVSGGSGEYSDTRDMNPTKSYWVWMKEDGIIAALS